MKEGYKEKTTFLIRYRLFKYIVMPFRLCNAPGTFQVFINKILYNFLDIFYTIYLDDILVYSDIEEEYIHHIR